MAVQSDPVTPPPEGKAAGVAAVLATTGAIGACVLCCTLPVAFPAAALALLGGGVAFLGLAHKAMTLVGLVAVLAAWGWVWLQSRRTGRRPARRTLQLMGLATALLALALAWPLVEVPLLTLLG
jgi:hypothetical protein